MRGAVFVVVVVVVVVEQTNQNRNVGDENKGKHSTNLPSSDAGCDHSSYWRQGSLIHFTCEAKRERSRAHGLRSQALAIRISRASSLYGFYPCTPEGTAIRTNTYYAPQEKVPHDNTQPRGRGAWKSAISKEKEEKER